MTEPNKDTAARHRRADRWWTLRIWIGGAFGVWISGSQWALDFWPRCAGDPCVGGPWTSVRSFIAFSFLFLILPIAGFVIGSMIEACIALWQRHFRRAASSILAIAALPACCLVVARVPLFDPWLWYAIVNNSRFETLAAKDPDSGLKYAVIENVDVSAGIAGVNPAHFVVIIYDESDSAGLEPSERRNILPWLDGSPVPRARRLYGHVFRLDIFY